MKLTKDEAVRLHRELWGWLAENPNRSKADWPRWECNGGDVEHLHSECFACEYVNGQVDPAMCGVCPLVWPGGMCQITGQTSPSEDDDSGLFDRWNLEDDTDERAKLAKQIRDLPVRED